MLCAMLGGLLSVPPPGLAAPSPASAPRLPPGQYALQLDNGRLSVQANDADLREVLQAIGREQAVEVTIDPQVQGTVTTSFTNLPLKEGLRRLTGSYAILFMREPTSGRESLLKVAVLQEGLPQASASELAASRVTIRAPPRAAPVFLASLRPSA